MDGDRKEKIGGGDSLTVGGDLQVKVGSYYALEAGMEIHLKPALTLVLEADMQISLKVGGNFIDISPAGVSIQGTLVMINSGGSPASGSGSKPAIPAIPKWRNPTLPTPPTIPKPDKNRRRFKPYNFAACRQGEARLPSRRRRKLGIIDQLGWSLASKIMADGILHRNLDRSET